MPDFLAWTPADWSAAAACATFVVAVVAAIVALVQYRGTQKHSREAQRVSLEQTRLTEEANRQAAEAAREQSLLMRRLAEEESRPYVVAYLEPSREGDLQVIDLVVRNFGKTAAHNVRLTIEPRPERAIANVGDEDRFVWLPDVIPTLVPGQEWRTLFDMAMQRVESDLPDSHQVVIDTEDSAGHPLPPTPCTLDWGQYRGRMWTQVRTMHDAAKALMDMEKHVKGWRETASGGLKVYVRDGDARDENRRAVYEERQAAHRALTERVLPRETDADERGEDG